MRIIEFSIIHDPEKEFKYKFILLIIKRVILLSSNRKLRTGKALKSNKISVSPIPIYLYTSQKKTRKYYLFFVRRA